MRIDRPCRWKRASRRFRQSVTPSTRGFTPPELVRFSADRAICTRLSRLADQLRGAGIASNIVIRKSGQPAKVIDTC